MKLTEAQRLVLVEALGDFIDIYQGVPHLAERVKVAREVIAAAELREQWEIVEEASAPLPTGQVYSDERLGYLYAPAEDEYGYMVHPSIMSMLTQVRDEYENDRAILHQQIAELREQWTPVEDGDYVDGRVTPNLEYWIDVDDGKPYLATFSNDHTTIGAVRLPDDVRLCRLGRDHEREETGA